MQGAIVARGAACLRRVMPHHFVDVLALGSGGGGGRGGRDGGGWWHLVALLPLARRLLRLHLLLSLLVLLSLLSLLVSLSLSLYFFSPRSPE